MIPAAVRLRPARPRVDEALQARRRGRRGRQDPRRRAVADPGHAAAAGRAGDGRRPRPGSPSCGASGTTATRIVIGAMTTHSDVLADPLIAAVRAADRRRRPRRWPTGRCATAAPSAARWRTPTRPATCRRWRWRSTPSSSSPGRAGGGPCRRRSSSSTTSPPRWRRARSSSRSGCPKLGGRLGHALREVQPGRAGVVDRRRSPRRCAGEDGRDRRGADRADQHGPDAAAGARRRGGAGRAPTPPPEAIAAAAEHAAEGTSPSSDLNAPGRLP